MEQVPNEPSFGWVGRTSFGGEPYNINNRIGHTVPTYDPYQNYDEEIQPRNEFATDDIFHQDQFGFDYDRSGDEGLDGFGTDDIFFNAETKNNGHSQRNSHDYSGWYFGFMIQYQNFIIIAFLAAKHSSTSALFSPSVRLSVSKLNVLLFSQLMTAYDCL